MKTELQNKLKEDFPCLFEHVWGGITCGDGWEPLIRKLAEELEPIGIKAVQVKEKFGGLRFYVDEPLLPELQEEFEPYWKNITQAESQSYKTCERCGLFDENNCNVATKSSNGWIKTLCEECRKPKKEENESTDR